MTEQIILIKITQEYSREDVSYSVSLTFDASTDYTWNFYIFGRYMYRCRYRTLVLERITYWKSWTNLHPSYKAIDENVNIIQ